MATVFHNKKRVSVKLHATANQTWTIVGNSSVSNVAIDDEILIGGAIKQVWAGSASGNGAWWEVLRGSNVVGVFDSTCWIDFAGNGGMLDIDSAGTLVVNLHNAASNEGYIIIELQKELEDGQGTY